MDDFDFRQQGNKAVEPEQDKTNKMIRAHSEDADQPGHPPSLIRVFAVHSVGSHGPKISLIRLGGCQGLSESSLCAQTILLLLPCDGLIYFRRSREWIASPVKGPHVYLQND